MRAMKRRKETTKIGVDAEKIGAKTEKAGSRCRKYGEGKREAGKEKTKRKRRARKKEEERTKAGRSARTKQAKETKAGKEKTKRKRRARRLERENESRGRETAKCRGLRRSFPELHQRTDAFLRCMLHDGLIGRLPIGVEREGRGGTFLFVQKLKGHTVVRVVEKGVEQGAFGEIAFPTFVLCLSELTVVDDEAVVDGEEFGEEIGLTI